MIINFIYIKVNNPYYYVFFQALVVSFLAAIVCYTLLAIIGYSTYGDNLKSQVTLNLPIEKISSKIAVWMIVMSPIVKYALTITPIAKAIEVHFQMVHRWSILAIRTLIVLSTVLVALFVPFFGSVVALSGSFFSVGISLLLPCTCYLKIFKNSKEWYVELVWIVIIIVVSVIVAIVGTYTSVRQIINAF